MVRRLYAAKFRRRRSVIEESLSWQRGQAVADRDLEELDRQFDRLEEELPLARFGLYPLAQEALVPVDSHLGRDPPHHWKRNSSVSCLILGLWMVPLGALLLAQDIPFLRRPVGQALVWLERQWIKWKRRRGG